MTKEDEKFESLSVETNTSSFLNGIVSCDEERMLYANENPEQIFKKIIAIVSANGIIRYSFPKQAKPH